MRCLLKYSKLKLEKLVEHTRRNFYSLSLGVYLIICWNYSPFMARSLSRLLSIVPLFENGGNKDNFQKVHGGPHINPPLLQQRITRTKSSFSACSSRSEAHNIEVPRRIIDLLALLHPYATGPFLGALQTYNAYSLLLTSGSSLLLTR